MEDLLNIGYLAITDANAEPMSDAFTREPNFTPYTATVAGNLCAAPVDPKLVPACKDQNVKKTAVLPMLHPKKWWADMTRDFNFIGEDKVDPEEFNEILWAGIKGDQIPYPERSEEVV